MKEIEKRRKKGFLTERTSVGREGNKGIYILCIPSRSRWVPRTGWASSRKTPPCSSFKLLLATKWGNGWLTTHVSIGNIPSVWHTKGMPFPIFKINAWPREMLWGRRWEGGSCLGTHVHPWGFMSMYGKTIQYCKVK